MSATLHGDRPRTMAAEWANFERTVLPVEIGNEQRMVLRRAFYAGAVALLSLQMTCDPGDEPTEADMALMEGISDELGRFARDVLEGKA